MHFFVYFAGCGLQRRVGPSEKVSRFTSDRTILIIYGRNKALVEKSCMLIVIFPTICGLVVRLLHHPTLYGHQFFRMLVRIFFVFRKFLLTLAILPVRDCGRFPVKVHEKLMRAMSTANRCYPFWQYRMLGCRC